MSKTPSSDPLMLGPRGIAGYANAHGGGGFIQFSAPVDPETDLENLLFSIVIPTGPDTFVRLDSSAALPFIDQFNPYQINVEWEVVVEPVTEAEPLQYVEESSAVALSDGDVPDSGLELTGFMISSAAPE